MLIYDYMYRAVDANPALPRDRVCGLWGTGITEGLRSILEGAVTQWLANAASSFLARPWHATIFSKPRPISGGGRLGSYRVHRSRFCRSRK